MKIKIFYSWQSDLPNPTNRSFIETQIKKTTKSLSDELPTITEFIIDSDSRNESGTPDLAQTIFNKINECNIFIADVSIINKGSKHRLVPNPNVLIELGYAAKTLGWSKVICIFNQCYANIEQLPFDIRGRKPIIYNSNNGINEEKKRLFSTLKKTIYDIVQESYLDNKESTITKRIVDLGMQAILIDFCQLLFQESKVDNKYDYQKLLKMTQEQIAVVLSNKEFLGFYFWRNIQSSIKDFIGFLNDKLETYFLLEKEKRLLAKMVFALREYNKLLGYESSLKKTGRKSNYRVVQGNKVNPNNPIDSYILLDTLKDDTAVVLAGGSFENIDTGILLNTYTIKDNYVSIYSSIIFSITSIINEWIKQTGKYFIADFR